MRVWLEESEITGLCTGISVESNLESAGKEAEITLVCAPMDSSLPRLDPACGQDVTVKEGEQVLFSGKAERVSYDAASLKLTLLAFDKGSLLAKNHCRGSYYGIPEDVTRQLCGECGLECGTVWPGDGKWVWLDQVSGRSVFRAIRSIYGSRCAVRWEEGKVSLYPVGQSRAVLESGRLVELDARNTVEDSVNQMIVFSKGMEVARATDEPGAAAYGLRRRTANYSKLYPSAEAQAWAGLQGLSRQARLTFTGLSPVQCGQLVTLDKPLMGVYGDYLVERVAWQCREGQTFTQLGVVSL